MGDGDNDMKIFCWEQLLRSRVEPADFIYVLTFGTMPIPAGVKSQAQEAASVFADIDMSAEHWGSAVENIADNFALIGTGWMLGKELGAVVSEDIGQLHLTS